MFMFLNFLQYHTTLCFAKFYQSLVQQTLIFLNRQREYFIFILLIDQEYDISDIALITCCSFCVLSQM